MNLSPRNLLGARAMLLPAKPLYDDGREPHVEEVIMYRCTICDELHDDEDDAARCCEAHVSGDEAGKCCPICGEKHDTYFAAVDRCLWIDLDFAKRLKVAAALENGSDWKTELALA